MYADDLVVFAPSAKGLQALLDLVKLMVLYLTGVNLS